MSSINAIKKKVVRAPTTLLVNAATLVVVAYSLLNIYFMPGIKIWTRVEKLGIVQPSRDDNMFDKMHRHLYTIAIEQPSNETIVRKRYTLGAVPESKGGLDDTDRELLGRLYYNASSVFEFGLGESTLIAAHVGVPRYSGVDSDAVWVSEARSKSKMDHFRFIFADIGNTGAWGMPLNDKTAKILFSYQSAPLYDELEPFDLYLVDGRYRVACFCSSMLHALSRGADMSRVMFGMHDWSRPHYKVVLEVADVVYESNRLAVLKLKPTATESQISMMWKVHIRNKH